MATLTLPGALRMAALLVEQLDYHGGITWGGTDHVDFHAKSEDEYRRLVANLPAGGSAEVQVGADYECDRYQVRLDRGLSVTVFGPHRDLPAEEAA